jgi:pantothenate kinase
MVRLLSCSPVADHDDSSQDLWLPSFDHAKQDPVPFDIRIPTTTRVVILEGNYVLLNQHPWSQIGEMSDERYATAEDLLRESSLTNLHRWFIDASRDVAKRRISQRHLTAKIEHTLRAAEERAETNDLPNGDFIRTHSVSPEVIIKND